MFNLFLSLTQQAALHKAFYETLYLLLMSALISIPLGTLMGYVLALYGKNKPFEKKGIAYTLSIVVSIIRSIPFILLMVMIIPVSYGLFGKSVGVIPSLIALSIIGFATVARMVEQAISELNPQIYDLAQSMGATQWQLLFNFILVEVRSGLILGYTTSLISLVAYSTVVYIIGGGGLGYTAIQVGYYEPLGDALMWASTIILIVCVQIIQMIGNILSSILNKKKRG